MLQPSQDVDRIHVDGEESCSAYAYAYAAEIVSMCLLFFIIYHFLLCIILV
jgi:hypothetical protein